MNKYMQKEILLAHKGKFIWKFIVSIILNFLLLAIPVYYSKIIDSLNNTTKDIYFFILVFALLTLVYRLIDYLNQKAYFNLYMGLYQSFMNLALLKTFNNSLYSLSRFSLSEYSNIMSEDMEMISDYYSTLVIRVVEILEFLYIIIYFFFLHYIIGFITLISALIVIIMLFYSNKFIAKTNIERKNRNDKRISIFQEIFLCIRAIKGFNLLQVIKDRLNTIVKEYIIWNIKLNIERYGLREIALGIVDVFKIISLIIGIKLILTGNMTLGMITIIYSYYAKLSELYTSIIVLSESINNKKVSENRVNKLFQYAQDNNTLTKDINILQGYIMFDKVLYGNKITPLLNEVSFIITGNSLNILSGSIKSSEGVFDLLLGYNRMHRGIIQLDDKNIYDYSRESTSHNIGFIMEYPSFFNTSIRDNLLIFDANFENIVNVCKYLDIDNYIMSLEAGYETILYDNASNINNDVRYLLALARLLLKKSKIMLINNILDHVSKPVYLQIIKIIEGLKKEHTIIMISNDMKIIKRKGVDKVIFFAYGKIIGIGKHEHLIKNNLEYQKLLKKI